VIEALKEWKFVGWEGGLAPAQDPHPLNTQLTALAEELFATCRADLSVEWVRISSGGKPTFPTCVHTKFWTLHLRRDKGQL